MNLAMLSRRNLVIAAGAASIAHPVAAAPSLMTRGYAMGPYGQIHYRDAVRGTPLVMMHQANNSSRQFERVYPLLIAAGLRPIGIDLPGYGNSDPPDAPPTVEGWAGIIAPVLDALRIDRANIFGHHTGSTVATEFSLQHPERTVKLLIHGAYLVTPDERAAWLKPLDTRQTGPVYNTDGSHLSSGFLAPSARDVDPEILTRYAVDRSLMRVPQWWGIAAVFNYDQEAALKKVRHPTLLLGNTGDQIYDLTLRARKLRPDFTYVELQGGTIHIQDEQPEAWTAAIIRYLET